MSIRKKITALMIAAVLMLIAITALSGGKASPAFVEQSVTLAEETFSTYLPKTKTITATVTGIENPVIIWKVGYKDASERETVSCEVSEETGDKIPFSFDVLYLTPSEDTLSLQIDCGSDFGRQIIIIATVQDNEDLISSCTLDFAKRIKGAVVFYDGVAGVTAKPVFTVDQSGRAYWSDTKMFTDELTATTARLGFTQSRLGVRFALSESTGTVEARNEYAQSVQYSCYTQDEINGEVVKTVIKEGEMSLSGGGFHVRSNMTSTVSYYITFTFPGYGTATIFINYG